MLRLTCASFFRRQLIVRPLLLSCILALSLVTALATVGKMSVSRIVPGVAPVKARAALLPAPAATFMVNQPGEGETIH